ncbi:MAG: sulfatase-like hydrolase/transferase [Chitinivibrionales bacterium]|nr:sulfatase-like hydrolase/transferase [Chitinivibrionales bacterium]
MAATAAAPSLIKGGTAQDKPNIIYILCDDLGYGDLACYGHPEIKTPHLNNLVTEGVKLTENYAAAPVCSPARAGFLTGRTPNRSGIYDHLGSTYFRAAGIDYPHLSPKEITIAELLKEVGYTTSIVGKWHLDDHFDDLNGESMPDIQGFDYYMATKNNAKDSHANPHNFVRNGVPLDRIDGYSNDIIVDECIDWMSNTRDNAKPFFLFCSFHSPHEPVATPDEYKNMYSTGEENKDIYYGNVTHLDAAVGRLLEYLDNNNLRDNTFVMFTSDNGPETLLRYGNGAARSYGTSGDFSCQKLSLYEGGIRVPGIARWPGVIDPGTESSEPICGIDMLPTFCAMTGAQVPGDRWIDGSNALAAFHNRQVTRHQPLFWKYYRGESCDDHPEDQDGNKPKIVLRDGDWKLCVNNDYRHTKLYNLANDPNETTNLVDQEQQRVTEMMTILQEISEDVKTEGENGEPIIRTVSSLRSGAPRFAIKNVNSIEIFSMTGKRMAHFTTKEQEINLKAYNLPRGLYTLRINHRHNQVVSSLANVRIK